MYREYLGISLSSVNEYPPCRRAEGLEPPACCQAPLEERTAVVDALLATAEASYPRACPECRSSDVYWIFDPDAAYFECPAGHRWEDA